MFQANVLTHREYLPAFARGWFARYNWQINAHGAQ